MSTATGRAQLAERLRARTKEIEEAVQARVRAIADPSEVRDPLYLEGLHGAITVALCYGFEAIENDEGRPPPVPIDLLVQARLAARNGVGLDTVLRRYAAGYAALNRFLVEESDRVGLSGGALVQPFTVQAGTFDQLVKAVSDEYEQARTRPDSYEERKARQVKRLLDGELLDAPNLGYRLTARHLGVVATGSGAAQAIRVAAKARDHSLLLVRPRKDTAWAWLGSAEEMQPAECEKLVASLRHPGASIAVGEPAENLGGWRLTHRQALAASGVAQRRGDEVVRYADVALLSALVHDDLLSASLCRMYLAPLGIDRGAGEPLRGTLRAYFKSDRNVSSAASALGISRQTVINRLRNVELRIGQNLATVASAIEIALELEELGDGDPGRTPTNSAI